MTVLREGMSWYSGWPAAIEEIRAIDFERHNRNRLRKAYKDHSHQEGAYR